MTAQLPDRLSIIVGASKGIGRHLARRAAARGDDVLAIGRAVPDLQALQRESDRVTILAADALAGQANEAMTSAIRGHEGAISVIVTAATIGPVGSLTAVEMAEWAAALQQNVVGTATIVAALLPRLAPSDLFVVFTGGGAGGPNPQPNVSSYTTSKIALMHLVEMVARENPDGAALLAVAPGAFPTGFTDPVLAAAPSVAGDRLIEDVRKTKALPFDALHLDTLFDVLEGNSVRHLSGSSISAKRDLAAVTGELPTASDLYRLRRVDGEGVVVNAW